MGSNNRYQYSRAYGFRIWQITLFEDLTNCDSCLASTLKALLQKDVIPHCNKLGINPARHHVSLTLRESGHIQFVYWSWSYTQQCIQCRRQCRQHLCPVHTSRVNQGSSLFRRPRMLTQLTATRAAATCTMAWCASPCDTHSMEHVKDPSHLRLLIQGQVWGLLTGACTCAEHSAQHGARCRDLCRDGPRPAAGPLPGATGSPLCPACPISTAQYPEHADDPPGLPGARSVPVLATPVKASDSLAAASTDAAGMLTSSSAYCGLEYLLRAVKFSTAFIAHTH